MKPTAATSLLAVGVAGGAVAYSAELVLVRLGEPILVPPITLSVALALIGVIIPLLAWPIRQAVRAARHPQPIDPFYATRVLLVAKASSLTASALAGVGLGVVVFLAGRTVVVWSQIWVAFLTVAAGVVMMVGALVAERWCVLPPGDEGESSGSQEGEPA